MRIQFCLISTSLLVVTVIEYKFYTPISILRFPKHFKRFIESSKAPVHPISSKKVILIHTGNNYGTLGYSFDHCGQYSNCQLTFNKTLMKMDEFAAIGFEARAIKQSDLHLPRSLHQTYIFLILEAPANSGLIDVPFNFFNYSMTYRRDSDLFTPYNSFQKISEIKFPQSYTMTPWISFNHNNNNYSLYNDAELSTRRGIYWIVSHCWTRSQRETYVSELRKYIPVDQYGACRRE